MLNYVPVPCLFLASVTVPAPRYGLCLCIVTRAVVTRIKSTRTALQHINIVERKFCYHQPATSISIRVTVVERIEPPLKTVGVH